MCSKFLISSSLLVLTCLVASNANAKVCFLPDCDGAVDIKNDINKDSKWCEKKGFTYYASGACPQYQKEVESCKKDDNYLKCDAVAWCKDKDNGYTTTSCALPTFLDQQCPNGQPLYKGCKEDTAKACKQLGYTNTCSGGQKLHASNGRCSWNNSYGTCCSPSSCPSYTSLSYSSYGSNGSDGCGYTCYYTCNMNCPSGTSTSNPGGCGGSTRNGCGTKTCYYPYSACCTPNCTNQTGCAYGTTSVSDGCGGTCTRCSEQPCNSSHPKWCGVHGSCHNDCCTDGSIKACDPQCGGSGCSTGGGSGGGSSVCGYWNADGTFAIPSSCNNYDGHGANAVINHPSSGLNLISVGYSFWNGATVNGGRMTVNGDVFIGVHASFTPASVTFNVPVTINGKIYISNGSSLRFNNGISGSYSCIRITSWTTGGQYAMSCPF